MKTKITINEVLNLSESESTKIKVHLAHSNGVSEPYDVVKSGFINWLGWNEWRGGDDDFNRDYILCLIPDYHAQGRYIFGGILKVEERFDDWEDTEIGYKVSLCDRFSNFIGRLIVEYYRPQGMGGRSFKYETLMDKLVVSEITQKPMAGFEEEDISTFINN